MVLGGQEAPVEVPGLANGHGGPVSRHHLHPGSRINLHQGVGDEDDVHAVEDRGQDGVPEAGLALEVEDADHDLALGVVASQGQSAGVREHGVACHADAQHGPILLRRVLDVSRRFVRQARRRQPILGRFGQPFRHEPLELWPALEVDHVPGGRLLWQALVAGFGGQGQVDVAAAQQEADLLWSGVATRDRHLDRYGHSSGHDAPVERTQEAQRVVVRVDEGYAVARLDAAHGVRSEPDSVQQCVSDLVRAAQKFAWKQIKNINY